MNPIGLQEIDEEDDAAEGPGDGIGPGHGGKQRDDFHRHGDVGHPHHTPAGKHGKHGHGGLAGTPHDTGDAMGESQQAVKQADGAHMLYAEGNRLRRVAEQADKLGSKQVGQQTHHLRHDAAAGDAEAHALFHPVVLSGAQVLPHEGGEGLGEAGHRQEGEALQLGVGAAARHGRLAKGVDIGLHHHIGHRDDAVLHAGGQTVFQNVQQALFIKADLLKGDPVGGIHPQQVEAAQQGADPLGDGGGDGGGAHAEAQHRHEQHIQHHVDPGGEDEVIQRMAAVPHGVEDAHEDVIHYGEDGAGKIPAEIADGLRQYLRRGVHPP